MEEVRKPARGAAFDRLQGGMRIFFRMAPREIPRHPLLAAANIASIALGVAVFTSILAANRNATSAFRSTVGLVSGAADIEIRGRIPEEALPGIASIAGVESATPVVEWIAPLADGGGGYLRILGIDPFTSGTLRPFRLRSPDGGTLDLESWLREPDAIAIFSGGEVTAPGEVARVMTPTGQKDFRPMFLMEPEDSALAPDPSLVAMDIAWAQEAGDLVGFFTSIQITLSEGASHEEITAAIRREAPGDALVQTPLGRTRQAEGMMASFQLNLVALSLVAMLVGCYLIYNSVAASVMRRRSSIGILRATGASSMFLHALFLGEAAMAGLLGSILGLMAAAPLTDLLTGFVSQTISSLYVLVSVQEARIEGWQAVLGLSVGVGASIIAAWVPSLEATRIDPKDVLHPGHLIEKAMPLPVAISLAGIGTLVAAWICGLLALRWNIGALGFVSAFLVVAGFSALVPVALRCFSVAGLPLAKNVSASLFLGLRNLSRSLLRNSITVAALAASIAMLVSISVMIHSFRASVASWMERTLVADLFVAPAANEIAGLHHPLPNGVVGYLRSHPNVAEIGTFRELPLSIKGEAAFLGIFDGRARGTLEFLDGEDSEMGRELSMPGKVAISESLATRTGFARGDRLSIPLPDGESEFQIVGIYRDYTRDSGTVLISLGNYLAGGGENLPHSVAVFLHSGADAAEFQRILRAEFVDEAPLSIYQNRELKIRIAEIFDQTFAVTGILRLIAIVVAAAGVLLGLGILVNERTREIGVLRAVGASRSQLFAAVLAEAGAIGALAAGVGLASGSALSLVLTFVINRAYFGWTVDLQYPLDFLAWTPVWVVATSLLAALPPASRALGIEPADALRYE